MDRGYLPGSLTGAWGRPGWWEIGPISGPGHACPGPKLPHVARANACLIPAPGHPPANRFGGCLVCGLRACDQVGHLAGQVSASRKHIWDKAPAAGKHQTQTSLPKLLHQAPPENEHGVEEILDKCKPCRICHQSRRGVNHWSTERMIYCLTHAWDGAEYGKVQFPWWHPTTRPETPSWISSAFDFPGTRQALGWQFSPSLSLTDHVSPTAPLTSSPQLRLSLTAHLSLGEQNKPGPSQLSQISQLLQISQNFNHHNYQKHLNYQKYHNSISCH